MAIKKTTLKLPPQHIEAEQSVLGALMIDKDAIIKISDGLRADDFYKPEHLKIYGAILDLFEKHQPIDLLSVTTRLKERDDYQSIGGSSYLIELVNGVPSASHVAHYAKIVREKRVLRDLIGASAEITELAFQPDDDVERLVDMAERRILAIAQKSLPRKFIAVPDELQGAYERIEKMHAREHTLRGVATGFEKLDEILSGLQPSDLIVLGSRPSLGKTSLALDIARHAAVAHGKIVGIFSLEMSKEQVIDRVIATEARVPLWRLRSGRITDDSSFTLIQAALDRLSRASIYIDDTPSPNILQMRAMARRLQAERGLDLVIVDYLQLVTPREGREMNMVQQITEISHGLKSLARELNVPVLALSQLSRAVDQRDVKIPRLSDLRESGSIEQDADVVLFIYRKDRDREGAPPEEQNISDIIIAKHRNGALGTVRLVFNQELVSFMNPDTTHGPAYA